MRYELVLITTETPPKGTIAIVKHWEWQGGEHYYWVVDSNEN